MSGQAPNTDDVNYQVYIDERKALVKAEQACADHFDKGIMTLAAGALGISLVFIEKIAPTPDPKTLNLLYMAWFSLVLSLLATLSSLLTGQYAFRRARVILENKFFPEQTSGNSKNGWAIFSQILNWSSVVMFITGAITLALFSIENAKFNSNAKPAVVTTVWTSNEKPQSSQ
jgi:hypothetical protein